MIIEESMLYLSVLGFGAVILAVFAFIVLKPSSRYKERDVSVSEQKPLKKQKNEKTAPALKRADKQPRRGGLKALMKKSKTDKDQDVAEKSLKSQPAGNKSVVESTGENPASPLSTAGASHDSSGHPGVVLQPQTNQPAPGSLHMASDVSAQTGSVVAAASVVAVGVPPDAGTASAETAKSPANGNGGTQPVNKLPKDSPADIPASTPGEIKPPAPAAIGTQKEEPKPAKSDNIFAMFNNDIVEESEESKFAKKLGDVDVHDLLEESQNLINRFSGRGGL